MTTQDELAKLAVRRGDYASALDHDARAWALRPDELAPIQHMIAVLLDSGKWLGAMAAIDLVREGASAETAFALDLATTQVLRMMLGVFPPPGARAEVDRVVARLSTGAVERGIETQISVARTLLELGRSSDASALLDRISQTSATTEQRAHISYLGGTLHERAGDLAAAISLYEQALALDARRGDAAINLLSALLELPDGLPRIGPVLLELDPVVHELPEVRFNEAIYLRHIGEVGRARELLDRLAAQSTQLGSMARQVLASC